ncbi:MAG: hypothetical protein JJU25_07410 [Halomonas sp.]|nr:hypothetical protein [Halomonas sp.]
MTRHDPNNTPHPAPTRDQRKAELLVKIEQQRVDILVEAERCRHGSLTLDTGFEHLERYRGLVYVACGVLLVVGIRHPHKLATLARRVAAGTLLLNRARRLFGQVR